MRGRIRSIKPELFSDEKLWDLGQETGLPVLQAFEGLWCFSDREGRFEWRPRALAAMILPYWHGGDMDAVLNALAGAGFVVSYEVDGKRYGAVRNFHRHQTPNNREHPSSLPPPPADASATRQPRVEHASSTRENLDEAGHFEKNKSSGNGILGSVSGSDASPTPVGAQSGQLTAERVTVTFRREFIARFGTEPSMGAKNAARFHETIASTAAAQQTDPVELLRTTLDAWLRLPGWADDKESKVWRQAPYACFVQAWGALTMRARPAPGANRGPSIAEQFAAKGWAMP